MAFSHDFIYAAEKLSLRCSEVDLGITIPPPISAIIVRKTSTPKEARNMILNSKAFNEKEGLEKGVIDGVFKENPLQKMF